MNTIIDNGEYQIIIILNFFKECANILITIVE